MLTCLERQRISTLDNIVHLSKVATLKHPLAEDSHTRWDQARVVAMRRALERTRASTGIDWLLYCDGPTNLDAYV